MNLLKPFGVGLEKDMGKAAHPWDVMDSSNPHHRKGWRLHQHGMVVVFVR